MKLKIATVILFLACVGMGVMLVMRQKEKQVLEKATEDTTAALSTVSNQWKDTSTKLTEQQQVNVGLEQQVKTKEAEVVGLSNKLTEVKTKLDKVESDAKAKEQAAQAELAKRDARINELLGEKDESSKRLTELTNRIGQLSKNIADAERRLSVSEGDREFLLKELKRLQAEKAELERQFNDLAVLKEQVKKLKEELVIARRIEFARLPFFSGLKGAELLMKRPTPSPAKSATNFSLNVEFKQDGAKVLPGTNTPAPPK